MAGSYRHCTNDDGTFRADGQLIDNMGDAHEACEMMHWLIRHLSGGDEQKIRAAEAAYYAEKRARYFGKVA